MGFLCNADSAISTCDSFNFTNKKTQNHNHNHNPRNKIHDHNHNHNHNQNQLRRFSYKDLDSATDHFSTRFLLGKGSHGSVYKSVLDRGFLVAAVKVPNSTNSTTITTTQVMKKTVITNNEIEILSSIRSPRIVNLIGYANEPKSGKQLLVVEYIKGGSLYDLIHKKKRPVRWSNRFWFAVQVAKAVQELHGLDSAIIHRDIKSTNVLIDEKGDARLSDFGLAVRMMKDTTMSVSLTTAPAGTLGYLDPCYLVPGDLTPKTDVFSFGVLLLELVSGRRAMDVDYSPPSIVEWAVPLIRSGSWERILDHRIGFLSVPTMWEEVCLIATRCVTSTVEKRPSMAEVVDRLEGAYNRVQSPMWSRLSSLRRRMRRVEETRPLVRYDSLKGGDADEAEVQGKMRRHGSRRSASRNRRVSSVSSADELTEGTRGGHGHRVGRSKSVGSGSRYPTAVTVTGVGLNKSRSVGVQHIRYHSDSKRQQKNCVDVCPLLDRQTVKNNA